MNKIIRYEDRLRLLWKLRRQGLKVRMHSYEYFIGDGKRFIGVLCIYPLWNQAVFHLTKEYKNNENEKWIKIIIEEIWRTLGNIRVYTR
ncbi:hypothetical protein B6U74_02035 [Candidatus Bathyarchaeota archaeon ex4484_205]|nr:MAG: hypothetical protein B6U74_02035 [Candidatus Bathyarchaeota archaeon ex4484_205]RLG68900.1 MAG: hypothetical protein DRN93_01575 [archaeon]